MTSVLSIIARKEGGELLLSLKGLSWLLFMSIALSAFGLLLVSNTELSLLDNAQVIYGMMGIVTVLGALLTVVTGVDSIAGERERGSLIPLILTPVSRGNILLGKLGGQALAWIVMFVLAMPYLWAVGSTGQNLFDSITGLALLGTPVVLGFGFFAMGLGAWTGSTRTSQLIALMTLMLSASPLVLGPGLRQSAIGKAFDTVNPFSAALNAYDAVVIDSQGLLAQPGHFLSAYIWLGLTLWFARTGINALSR